MNKQQKVLGSNEIDEILKTGTQIFDALEYIKSVYYDELPGLYRGRIVKGLSFTEKDVNYVRKMAREYLESANSKMEESQKIGEQYPDSNVIGKYLSDMEKLTEMISEKASDKFIDDRVEACRGK